jgi:hypothetical protein
MLEILFIVFLYKKLKARLLTKNRSSALAWFVVLTWLGGEFIGAIAASIVFAILGYDIEGNLAIYGCSILSAAFLTGILFLIINSLDAIPLRCPACQRELSKTTKWTIDCEHCEAKIKVVDGKATLVQAAL